MPLLRKKPEADPALTAGLVKLAAQPAYAQEQSRYEALIAARQKLSARIREIDLIIGTQPSFADITSQRVDAALKFAETGVAQIPTNDIGSLRDEHMHLRSQAEALDRAITEQRGTLDATERRLTAECFAANRSKHDEIMKRYVAKLRELDAVVAEEEAFIASMHAAGYDVNPPARALWPTVGTLLDPNSMIAMRLRELRKFDDAA